METEKRPMEVVQKEFDVLIEQINNYRNYYQKQFDEITKQIHLLNNILYQIDAAHAWEANIPGYGTLPRQEVILRIINTFKKQQKIQDTHSAGFFRIMKENQKLIDECEIHRWFMNNIGRLTTLASTADLVPVKPKETKEIESEIKEEDK